MIYIAILFVLAGYVGCAHTANKHTDRAVSSNLFWCVIMYGAGMLALGYELAKIAK